MEEEFVESHVVCFTGPLVSVLEKRHWTDKVHFDANGTETLLQHACGLESVRELLARRDGKISIVYVLSDGWNRSFSSTEDRSKYWRCRLDFGRCTSLSDFQKWCTYYASWRPRNTEPLPL